MADMNDKANFGLRSIEDKGDSALDFTPTRKKPGRRLENRGTASASPT